MAAELHLDFHTDDPDLRTLCERYWALDADDRFVYPVTPLAKAAGYLVRDVGKIVYQNCDAYTLDDACSSCGSVHLYLNRSEFTQRRQWVAAGKEWVCDECTAEKRAEAEARKQAEQDQVRARIREYYSIKPRAFDINALTLRDALFLLAMIRHLAHENLQTLRAIDTENTPLTPSREYDVVVLMHLIRRKLIAVDTDASPVDAFIFDDDNAPSRVYTLQVHWLLTADTTTPAANVEFVRTVEDMLREGDWLDDWSNEVLPLWREIALQECLAYLVLALNDHQLPFKPGEKTIEMFNQVLTYCAPSQVYALIWRAAKDAAAYYVRDRVPKQQAANTVVGAIQRAAERAQANKWEMFHYNRDRRLPASTLSQVLFNVVLGMGDEGFRKVPEWNILLSDGEDEDIPF